MNRVALWGVVGLLAVSGACQVAEAQLRKSAAERPGRGNEVEGAVWQYTATIDKKDQKLSGKIRIDGRAIFEHTGRRVLAEKENRIGDITTSTKDTMQMVFNEHPELKGRAVVEYDRKAGYWRGYFDEKDGTRWKFEMRRGDG